MIQLFFRGRENTQSRGDRDKKKAGISRTERRQNKIEKAERDKAEKQKARNRFSTGNPILSRANAKLAKYRLDCGNSRCGNKWFGNTQEPFCPRCGSILVSWTLNFNDPPEEFDRWHEL